MVQVMVELRIPAELEEGFALETAGALDAAGFVLDEAFPPVPSSPPAEHKATLEAAREKLVLVRGRVDEDRIPELRARPEVFEVWHDTHVEPMGGEPFSP
jgi:hypothetical protein